MTSIERAAAGSLWAVLAVVLLQGCDGGGRRTSAPENAAAAAPKVILIIGDGMDDQQITIARNYLVGSRGRLTLDGMPFRGAVQVQTLDEDDPSRPEYVADSANSATSMATGVLTSAGRIATTAKADVDVTTIMELAQAAGMGTGIVTTASVTDATPASFVAHIGQRGCEGPEQMIRANGRMPWLSTNCTADLKASGGAGSIAEQIAASDVDVVLGGGRVYFDQVAEGEAARTVLDLATANGFRFVDTSSALDAVGPGGKVLGLFARGTMPVALRGKDDAQAQLVAHENGQPVLPAPFTCEPNPRFEGTPRLAAMARAALAHLDDGRSFMLMIESASIDKQSHLRRPCGQIGEVAQLEETLQLALDYVRGHPETLVLVTADHGQAAKLIPERSSFAPLGYASPGYFARVLTSEGAIMGVNYATNDSPIQEDHSGVEVPLFAGGPGARGLPAFLPQTEVFEIAARHLGLRP